MPQSNKTHNLFEFANKLDITDSCDASAFDDFLDDLWKKRGLAAVYKNVPSSETAFKNDESNKQRFLTFLKGNQIKARNYIGIIRFQNQTFNLLPKIFYEENKTYSENEIEAIQAHILWWLSYCSKFKFPKSFSGYNSIKSDFFEILIYLFASLTRKALSYTLYQSYQEIQDARMYMKGRLDSNAYIKNNLSIAKWQNISCSFDSFEVNNLYNQIIKYVARLLLINSQNLENKKILQEIIFILDDVSDTQQTVQDCQKVKLNPLFKDMAQILDYCKLFLANSTVLSYKNHFQVFAFLLPTEYVFEDFIYGFLKQHLNDHFDELTYQKTGTSLATLYEEGHQVRNVFELQHDLFIKRKASIKPLIIDCKYKIIYLNQSHDEEEYDPKYGIAQSDLYQLTAYAIRRGVDELFLFYPSNPSFELKAKKIYYLIEDVFNPTKPIKIHIHQLPIIQNLSTIHKSQSLESNFHNLEEQLKATLKDILA